MRVRSCTGAPGIWNRRSCLHDQRSRMMREMEMGLWLERAEAELKELA